MSLFTATACGSASHDAAAPRGRVRHVLLGIARARRNAPMPVTAVSSRAANHRLEGVGPDTMADRMVVALGLDTSGSLSQVDADRRTTLALQLTLALPPGSEVAVFSFDDEPRLVQERTSDPGRVLAAVGWLERSGRFTALHDAVFDASRYLAAADAPRRAIVLITDGNDENSALTFEDAVAAAREHRVPVFTVGVGRVQERVLRRLSALTRGEYLGRRPKADVAARRVAAAPVPTGASGTTPRARSGQ